ncbi:hypothetical protein OQA88_10570 [Cercophora sp. LCS_1]
MSTENVEPFAFKVFEIGLKGKDYSLHTTTSAAESKTDAPTAYGEKQPDQGVQVEETTPEIDIPNQLPPWMMLTYQARRIMQIMDHIIPRAMVGFNTLLTGPLIVCLVDTLTYRLLWKQERYEFRQEMYEFRDVTPADARDAHLGTPGDAEHGEPSHARTPWYAVRETKQTDWVQGSAAMPKTPARNSWLDEA